MSRPTAPYQVTLCVFAKLSASKIAVVSAMLNLIVRQK
jgi:hypothetical protein